MSHITSAGGILCAMKDQTPFLLLLRYPDGRLTFPKGQVDPGETIEQAACREVQEETGCYGIQIVQKLGEISYTPRHETQIGNTKTMHIFLITADARPNTGEDPTEWVPLAVAMETMDKPEERALLRKYQNIISATLSPLPVD